MKVKNDTGNEFFNQPGEAETEIEISNATEEKCGLLCIIVRMLLQEHNPTIVCKIRYRVT